MYRCLQVFKFVSAGLLQATERLRLPDGTTTKTSTTPRARPRATIDVRYSKDLNTGENYRAALEVLRDLFFCLRLGPALGLHLAQTACGSFKFKRSRSFDIQHLGLCCR